MQPRHVIMAIFLLQPIAYGAWLPRIPDLQHRLGLDTAQLSLVLIGLPIGVLVTLPVAGRVVARLGAAPVMRLSFLAYLAVASLPGFATSPAMLFVFLLLLGICVSTLELTLNVAADAVEKSGGRLIMSTCHGFWSLGIMAGNLAGAALAGLAVSPGWAGVVVALGALPLAILSTNRLPALNDATRGGERAPLRLPGLPLLAICAFCFGVTMTEGSMADWSAVFLRTVLAADPVTAGLGYSAFALMVAAGRFLGDVVRKRSGTVALGRACAIAALAGVALVVTAPGIGVALAGFAIAGIGASAGFPLAVTAAAGLGDRSAAANVATLSFMALLGFLVGPPLIGFVARSADLRLGLSALLPIIAISVASASALVPRPAVATA